MEDVKYIHLRKKNGATGEIRSNGGLTIAIAPDTEVEMDKWYVYSIAKCSRKDAFNRKIGRNVSGGRVKAYFNGRDMPTEKVQFVNAADQDINAIADNLRNEYKAKGYV